MGGTTQKVQVLRAQRMLGYFNSSPSCLLPCW